MREEKRVAIQVLLFILTFFTTLVAGTGLVLGIPLERPYLLFMAIQKTPANLFLGLVFSVPLLSILAIHEMGHYVAARRHNVAVTPPYFLPAPSFIGTFGAFIRIKSPVPHRDALLDIGAAGPIAGALVAIPVLLIGLKMSAIRPSAGIGGIPLGESLLFRAASFLVLGEIPNGYDVVLHPVAFAGWIGLLVTALNLLPSGQLDGGHIAYALFGDRYEKIARAIPFVLLPMGFLWGGWIIWSLLLLVLGTSHPRPVFDEVPLSQGRRRVGILAGILFLACFTPNPVPM
ncbi:MAG: site-2 protease family protein [Deltaproteobacteria bacterium]|nr:site-2 protease family protein [Deltaproteobacteria bacterium]